MGTSRTKSALQPGFAKPATLTLFLCLAVACSSQTHPSHKPRFDKAVYSPEVSPDRRVTFRFKAPGASDVTVLAEELPDLKLTKDAQGVWSGTTEPLAPDFYQYMFKVDGVYMPDPANTLMKTIATGGIESILHVPGAALPWESADGPHGVIHHHVFRFPPIGEDRDFWVYTPPGYNKSTRSYPALYLLHGVMEDSSAWLSAGRAAQILDNLIDHHQAEPRVVIMLSGYGFPNVPDDMVRQFGGTQEQKGLMQSVDEQLVGFVIPIVEQEYRVAKARESRQVAGLSLGGAQAIYLGLNHPDLFSSVGAFSPAVITFGANYETFLPRSNSSVAPPPMCVWCGRKDFLLPAVRKFSKWLPTRNVHVDALETDGQHTWNVWRRDLVRYLTH